MLRPNTPGPWRAAGTNVYLDREGLDMLTVVAKCPRRMHSPEIRKTQAEANARLIAAAPELLMLAEALLAATKITKVFGPEDVAFWAKEASAAIRKATEPWGAK